MLITINETEQRRNRKQVFGWVLISAGMIELILFSVTMTSAAGVVNLILAINFFLIGAGLLLIHREKFFISLTDENIEWNYMEKQLILAMVSWDDIRWIKKENDRSLTIYKDSSFSHNINMSCFSVEDSDLLLSAIRKTGSAKAIRLVNF